MPIILHISLSFPNPLLPPPLHILGSAWNSEIKCVNYYNYCTTFHNNLLITKPVKGWPKWNWNGYLDLWTYSVWQTQMDGKISILPDTYNYAQTKRFFIPLIFACEIKIYSFAAHLLAELRPWSIKIFKTEPSKHHIYSSGSMEFGTVRNCSYDPQRSQCRKQFCILESWKGSA